MLKSFRDSIKGFMAWIVVALFVLAFAFVGVPALENFGGKAPLQVGDQRYSVNDIDDEFARVMERNRQDTGEVLSQEEARAAGMLGQAINALTIRGVYVSEAGKLGLTVTDDMIQDYLQSDERFRAPGKDSFDQATLQAILQNNRMSLNDFRQAIRTELLTRQIDEVAALLVPAPTIYGKTIALRQTEERVVRIARLSAGDVPAPTDEQLQSFYAANADRYRTPERRTYTAVLLTPDVLDERIQIDDADVRKLFEARQATMSQPETRTFVQAQFPSMEAANAAVEAVANGQSFAEAAETAGVATARFDDEVKGDLVDSGVADAVFGLDGPGLVGPVDGDFGVVVAEVTNITPGTDVTYEEVADELRQELFEEVYADEIDTIYDELQESGDAGSSLADAARDLGLPVMTIGPVDRTRNTDDGQIEERVPLSMHMRAFDMSSDQIFEEVTLPEGNYGFIEVDSVEAGAVKPLAEVQDQVKIDYISEQAQSSLANASSSIRSAMAGGETFEIAALQAGAQVETRTLSNSNVPPNLSQDLIVEIFDAPIGEMVQVTSPDRETMTLAQTESISFGPNGQWETMAQRMDSQIAQSMSRDLYEAFFSAMSNANGIQRNDAAINARFGAGE
ncbi:peptidylprolyl isomerase [Parvularcula sp. LCG005]|uniref:peptidylprolyl isomerase n=1 Tax=Parvularcula sp. LCG005 TaxID=3078805 RepID=UPI00294232C9|nr:SurA N-terminal domain-containing protein [Parvularcula sp. LCG005]WOI52078.1 SurA N-terminal domain-containing protein [Parvularcula sp. LCG005]